MNLRQWVLDREDNDVDEVVAELTVLVAAAVTEARREERERCVRLVEDCDSFTVTPRLALVAKIRGGT